MPGLVAWKRHWRVSSDDLSYPAIVEAITRGVWLLLETGVLAVFHYQIIPPGCGTLGLLAIYYLGLLCIMLSHVVLSGLIAKKAMLGTIANPTPRANMEKLLKIKFTFWCFEILWALIGTFIGFGDDRMSDCYQILLWIVRIMAASGWVLIAMTVVGFLAVYDSAGDHDYRIPGAKRKYSLTCRALCWGSSEDANYKRAFLDVAHILEDFFDVADLVKTDIVAGMMLINQRQRGYMTPRRINMSGESEEIRLLTSSLDQSMPIGPKSWMTVQKAAHFMQFAGAAYGKQFYTNGKSCGCCGLWSCNGCACGDTEQVVGDGCCHWNTAAVVAEVGLAQGDIIYSSFYEGIDRSDEEELPLTPFYVAIDHRQKSVVIAIRGTTNMQVLLEMAQGENQEVIVEIIGKQYIHQNIYLAALKISEILEKQRILVAAQNRFKSYNLVITGHGTGAGVAAVLALLMRDDYEETLQCFAFSPPGWLISEGLREYTEEFICSVVLGHDIVPRIGIVNLERFKQQLLRYVRDCTTPKHHILATGCWLGCCGIPKTGFNRRGDVETGVNRGGGASPDMLEKIEYALKESEKQEEAHFPMYMPGQVLYVESMDESKGTFTNYRMHWTSSDAFDHVVVGVGMVDDHQPHHVLTALQHLTELAAARQKAEAATLKRESRPPSRAHTPSVIRAQSLRKLNETQSTPGSPVPSKQQSSEESEPSSPHERGSPCEPPIEMVKTVPIVAAAAAPVFHKQDSAPAPLPPQGIVYKPTPLPAAVAVPAAAVVRPAASQPATYSAYKAATAGNRSMAGAVNISSNSPFTATSPGVKSPTDIKPNMYVGSPTVQPPSVYSYTTSPAAYKPIGSGPTPYRSKDVFPQPSYVGPMQTSSPKPEKQISKEKKNRPTSQHKAGKHAYKSDKRICDSDSDIPEACADVLEGCSSPTDQGDVDSLDSVRMVF